MLLSVTGASGSGKSTVLDALSAATWDRPVTCVEFDSIGVPENADTHWRHAAIEWWIQRAIDAQRHGSHVVLFGQVPIGELLAAPSADRLDGVASCLLDCSAQTRRERLLARGDAHATLDDHVSFGEWFRGHSTDPQYRIDVIRVQSGTPMRWERWEHLLKDDPRWPVTIIDTAGLAPEDVAELVQAWVHDALQRKRPVWSTNTYVT